MAAPTGAGIMAGAGETPASGGVIPGLNPLRRPWYLESRS